MGLDPGPSWQSSPLRCWWSAAAGSGITAAGLAELGVAVTCVTGNEAIARALNQRGARVRDGARRGWSRGCGLFVCRRAPRLRAAGPPAAAGRRGGPGGGPGAGRRGPGGVLPERPGGWRRWWASGGWWGRWSAGGPRSSSRARTSARPAGGFAGLPRRPHRRAHRAAGAAARVRGARRVHHQPAGLALEQAGHQLRHQHPGHPGGRAAGGGAAPDGAAAGPRS